MPMRSDLNIDFLFNDFLSRTCEGLQNMTAGFFRCCHSSHRQRKAQSKRSVAKLSAPWKDIRAMSVGRCLHQLELALHYAAGQKFFFLALEPQTPPLLLFFWGGCGVELVLCLFQKCFPQIPRNSRTLKAFGPCSRQRPFCEWHCRKACWRLDER